MIVDDHGNGNAVDLPDRIHNVPDGFTDFIIDRFALLQQIVRSAGRDGLCVW